MTLDLSHTLYKRLVAYLLAVCIFFLTLEIVLHSLLPSLESLPPRSYGLEYRRLEVQLARLDAFVAQHGRVDCIVIGSSLVEHGVDPSLFEAHYQAAFGAAIDCFNMGLGSITASGQAVTVEMLLGRYQPRLILVGTEARAYNEAQLLKLGNHVTQAEQRLPDEAWMRYQRGEWSPLGWLIDHSALLQAYQLLATGFRLDAQNETLAQALAQTCNGYTPLTGQVINVRLPVDRANPQDGDLRQLEFFSVYTMSEHDLAGLRRMAQLHRPPSQIVIVEMPVHPSYLDYFAAGPQTHQSFIQTVSNLTQAEGALFWPSTPQVSNTIPTEAWNDRYHVNQQGAPILTAWLAEQVIQAIQSGQLEALHKPAFP